MRRMYSWIAALLLCSVSVPAYADTVVLLGLRSVEGDDDFANTLTQALRTQLGRISGVQLSDRAVSLSQMGMAYGCEEPDAACLTDIAAGLQTQHVIYGTIRRTSTRENFQYNVSLSFFSGDHGSIENTVTRNVPQSGSDLSSAAQAMLTALLGMQDQAGTIVVRSNAATADVTVNGQPVGTTVDGTLRLSGLAPGRYEVIVRAEAMRPYRTSVTVTAGESSPVNAELAAEAAATEIDTSATFTSDELAPESSNNGQVQRIIGYSLLGLSAVALIGTVWSWAEIGSINGDSDFQAYRTRVGASDPTVKDVCATTGGFANQGSDDYITWRDKIRPMCDDAGLFETLQWVFLGTAVAAGGAGAFLLITAPNNSDSSREQARNSPSWTVRPRVTAERQTLEATFRF